MIRDEWHPLDAPKFRGLPILWVERWDDLTPAVLEREWTRMLAASRSYDMRRLYAPYWISELLQLGRAAARAAMTPSVDEACTRLTELPSRGSRASPSGWLAAAAHGHCGYTERRTDCAFADRGSFGLPVPRARASWEAAAEHCLAECAACARCRYVSVSLHHGDCSWYSQCDGFEKAPAFRSAAAFAGLRAPVPAG